MVREASSRRIGSAGAHQQQEPVVVVATRLALRNWCQLRRFFRLNSGIKRQLRGAPGLVRYRRRANFLRLHFFTQSIWRDAAALDDFVRTGAHLEAMVVFDEVADRDTSAFLRWEVLAAKFPTWRDARTRLAEHGAS